MERPPPQLQGHYPFTVPSGQQGGSPSWVLLTSPPLPHNPLAGMLTPPLLHWPEACLLTVRTLVLARLCQAPKSSVLGHSGLGHPQSVNTESGAPTLQKHQGWGHLAVSSQRVSPPIGSSHFCVLFTSNCRQPHTHTHKHTHTCTHMQTHRRCPWAPGSAPGAS